ncbi:MAG: ATP-binding protein [Candidatus Omnitrophica bacterium]|nr:ATP-binding protein [Candidatus Omnitrophota bacterium]MDD5737925.1 ATP-binding protein [Candidatus Omnitrophota bacterium]
MTNKKEKAGINPTDFGFSIVKLAAAIGALIWGIYHPFSAHDRVVFLWLIAAFFAYNFVIYLSIFRLPDRASKIYLVEFLLDLTFLAIVVPITGGLNSTFTLGYFLIAAAQAFYYGLAGSIWIALVSVLTYMLSCPHCLYVMHWTDLSLRAGFLTLFTVMMGYLSDRERRMHRQLVNAEQLAAMGMMSAQLAHSVRNPLSTISLSAELLEDEIKKCGHKDTEEATTLVKSIVNEVYRINDVIEDHLNFMKRSRTGQKRSNVNVIVDSLIRFLEKEGRCKGISFRRSFDENLPDAAIEESRLRQVLLNIVRNSFEAMPEGGYIEITTGRQKNDVEISVCDNGPGIPREYQKRIFEPFFTTKDIGTGLGLYIARDIILESGGGISCDSKKDKGTMIKLRLPFAA